MANNYNVFKSLDNIYDKKVKWLEANKAGDRDKANKIAQDAGKYYQELRDNNYHGLADEMQRASDEPTARNIRNFWGQYGKTAIRPYLSKLAGQYSDATGKKLDINDYLSYNETTGEVSLGGRNIGKPYSEVDGVTYWEPEKLQKEFKQFVSDIGASVSDRTAYDTSKLNGLNYIDESYKRQSKDYDAVSDERSKLNDTYHKLYGENMNANPFDTEWGKAIMQRYSLNGAKAANNAVASSVGSNGGNIDSYAAANAMRQNLAYESAGQAAVLDAFNSKMNNAYNILQGLGVNVDSMRTDADSRFNNGMTAAQLTGQENQRLFNNSETSKNNEVARQTQISDITGYVPTALMGAVNPYLNADGTVSDIWMNDETGGIQAEIERLDKQIETENDPVKRASLRYRRNMAAQARNQKISQNMDKYGSLTPSFVEPMQTETGRGTDLGYYMTKDGINADVQMAQLDSQTELSKTAMNNASAERLMDMKIEADKDYNESKKTENKTGEKDGAKSDNPYEEDEAAAMKYEMDNNITGWLYSPYADITGEQSGEWRPGYKASLPQYIAAEKIADPEALEYIKEKLRSAGFDPETEIDVKLNEYRIGIAKRIATSEGRDASNQSVLDEILGRYGISLAETK